MALDNYNLDDESTAYDTKSDVRTSPISLDVDFSKYTPYGGTSKSAQAYDPGKDPLSRRRSSESKVNPWDRTWKLDNEQVPWVYTPESYTRYAQKPEPEAPERPKAGRVTRSTPVMAGTRGSESARVSEYVTPTRVGQVTTSEWEFPDFERPELDLPDFEAPKYDRRRVRQLAQQQAAPQVRKLRNTVQQAMGQGFENPNVRAMTLRQALEGYGLGLEGALAGAHSRAAAEYKTEYEGYYDEAVRNFDTDVKENMAEFEAAWNDYLKGFKQKSTTANVYEDRVRRTASYVDDYYQPASSSSVNKNIAAFRVQAV